MPAHRSACCACIMLSKNSMPLQRLRQEPLD
jgi:hypothetical protein